MKDPLEIISAQQGERLDRIKTLHELGQRSAREPAAYAYLCGVELLAAKDEIPHGQFMEWHKRYLPDLSKGSISNYMALAKSLQPKLPTVGNLTPDRLLTNGQLDQKAKEEIFDAFHDIADGKTLTQLYRDLGVIRQPTPPGGFRPDAKALQAWLKEHHPDLAGAKYDALPAAIQKAFRKQYKPLIDPVLEAENARDAIRSIAANLYREFDAGTFAHFHVDDPTHVQFIEDFLGFLTGDLMPGLRAQLHGAPKPKHKKKGAR